MGQVLSRQPDYADAARKLELARQQQELAMRYAQALAAANAADWEQAVAGYSWIVDAYPGYRDTNARLAAARHQHQVATLQAEAHRLHRAGQWAAVIKVGEQLQAVDPALADSDRSSGPRALSLPPSNGRRSWPPIITLGYACSMRAGGRRR